MNALTIIMVLLLYDDDWDYDDDDDNNSNGDYNVIGWFWLFAKQFKWMRAIHLFGSIKVFC